jgi:hypothetical protein
MSLLPNAANATLDDAKISQYLLNPAHPVGGSKAKFFLSRGFTQANWTELKTDAARPSAAQSSRQPNRKCTRREIRDQLLARYARPHKSLCHFGMEYSTVRSISAVRYRVSESGGCRFWSLMGLSCF